MFQNFVYLIVVVVFKLLSVWCYLIRRSYQQLCDARSADRVAAKAKKAAEAEKDKAVAAAAK
jgi:hypothetical protein